MYMQGFEWEASTCLVYLFQTWIISTRVALVVACLGTIALSMLVELLIRKRRVLLSDDKNGKKKMFLSASLYGAQLTISYLIMLLVMSYSGPLFISVVFGLMIGHLVSNWSEVTNEIGSGRVGMEGSTPCCANFLENYPLDGGNQNGKGTEEKKVSKEERESCCNC